MKKLLFFALFLVSCAKVPVTPVVPAVPLTFALDGQKIHVKGTAAAGVPIGALKSGTEVAIGILEPSKK